MKYFVFFLISSFLLTKVIGCSSSTNEMTYDSSQLTRVSAEDVEKVVEDFIMAEDSAMIGIPAEFNELSTQLI